MQRVIAGIASRVPAGLRHAILGNPDHPSALAHFIHRLLNGLPGERYPVLPCSGVLQGFRMKVDWRKHRSFVYGSWEPEVVDTFLREVRPGMTALDIGAQSGFYTLLLSRLVGDSGLVVAFEPLPANFRVLRENVELNKLTNVWLLPQAVAAHSGHCDLDVPDEAAMLLAGPFLDPRERQGARVSCVPLDEFLENKRLTVQFVKMDVEGAEGEILEGARRMMETHHPAMLVELHNFDTYGEGHPVTRQLTEAGYRVEWLKRGTLTAHILARRDSGKAVRHASRRE